MFEQGLFGRRPLSKSTFGAAQRCMDGVLEVEKANPYHDEKGRFTSKDKAKSVSHWAKAPGPQGRVSGTIRDKSGEEYTVWHSSSKVEVKGKEYDKHTFKVYTKDKFSAKAARDGSSEGLVNETVLHYSGTRVMNTSTAPEYRRRGIASALYDHIESVIGKKLEEHYAQSDDAKALWASRKLRGSLSGDTKG